MKALHCIFFFLAIITGASAQSTRSKKAIADSLLLADQKAIVAFLHLADSDRVADIGTGAGYQLVPIANAYPQLYFTAEDIDSNYCNKARLLKQINATGNKTSIDHFTIQYGTTTSTNLPNGQFTKVLLFDVLHEMECKPAMLANIKSVLQASGTLFIEEILVHKKMKKERACNYPYLTEQELLKIMEDNHYLVKQSQTINDTGHNKYIRIFECQPAK